MFLSDQNPTVSWQILSSSIKKVIILPEEICLMKEQNLMCGSETYPLLKSSKSGLININNR